MNLSSAGLDLWSTLKPLDHFRIEISFKHFLFHRDHTLNEYIYFFTLLHYFKLFVSKEETFNGHRVSYMTANDTNPHI